MIPLSKKITGIFIPVKDIEKARDWYCDLLAVQPTNEFPGGHLYVIEFNNLNLVLDSKIYSEKTIIQTPLFHFDTDNVEQSYQYIHEKGIELTSNIQFNQFFNFKDPDGNHLMMCQP
ncbi:VOC family protein [Gracilibacillus kekensis]|uniref:Catechol 2,3-dioxygenase n=1 Tax=Gracilibacillus kekensis TaxID=1027249 RepID=A0A1M7J3B8_9BACI|nr:VOC family protein [Gracilibacillus kekensis]SHM47481.1 Catechol 2,3-dioxygenase [Gracilibacillus kekensis]